MTTVILTTNFIFTMVDGILMLWKMFVKIVITYIFFEGGGISRVDCDLSSDVIGVYYRRKRLGMMCYG
jgi:hypothetical protein